MKQNKEERKTGLVRLRGGFSDTSGIAPQNKTIQLNEFDDDTRTRISNKLHQLLSLIFENPYKFYYNCDYRELTDSFSAAVFNDAFCQNNFLRGTVFHTWQTVFSSINEVIEQATFNEVLDIVEYICRWFESSMDMNKGLMCSEFNILFEQEYVGYRFVNGRIAAISDTLEIDAIEEACRIPFEGARVQIQKSLDFLSDRENKDYKNSIKESISAVESICQVIMNDENATLGDTLKKIEDRGVVIHPALKQAFIKLYGYTSDKGGIRHAEGMFESEVTFEEAKFMLVSCSAFINYLIAEMGKGDS